MWKSYIAYFRKLRVVLKDKDLHSDFKLLSGFPWPINRNPDNNLKSLCMFKFVYFRQKYILYKRKIN
jgi:hypothetical protein